MLWRNAHAPEFIHGFPVGVAGALRDPCPIRRAQDGFKRRHKAAGRHRAFHRVAAPRMLVRFTVGDYKQAAALKPGLNKGPQPLLGPQRFAGVPQPRFFLRGGARSRQRGRQARCLALERSVVGFLGQVRAFQHRATPQIAQPLLETGQRTPQAPT